FNNLTVKENLFLAFDNEDTKFFKNLFRVNRISKKKQEKIREMLKLVAMEKFENQLTRDLSYGQKRLIELLRTILNPHKFLILDEPVAGVTPKLREKIGEILKKLENQGETILLIEHDMNFTLNLADIVVVMEKGRVIAHGKPEEIRNNPRVLQSYLGE
ncbi:ATP-binding cassette domain-containing protein, partial [Patescibacteria group bacterium]|nr:ATP-binding cassette domain-containing protein [Patescibacteria group bacterium]